MNEMQLLLKPALAAAAASSVAAAPPTGTGAAGWQRALQRAQAQLSGAPASSGPRPWAARGPMPQHEAGLEHCGVPMAAAGVPLPASPVSPPAADGVATWTPPGADPVPQPVPGERTPIRVHVDARGPQGLRVWLGIDGDPTLASQRATAAVTGLRLALHANRERLELLVCNGAVVHAAVPPSSARAPRVVPLSSLPFDKDAP